MGKNERPQLTAVLEVLKSGYWYEKKVKSVLKTFGISHEQFNVLRILDNDHTRKFSLKEIQSRLMNKTANATRLVEKLKRKGYVTSNYSKTNRRTLEIGITDSGIKLLDGISPKLNNLGNEVESVLNESDSKSLIRILRNFRKV